jgi:Uncharacterized conserved protein
MPEDKFNIKYFHPSKVNGWFYQMSDNPKNDPGFDAGGSESEMSFPGGGILIMEPNGATDFGLGKNVRDFGDSIGGCDMDFAETADRGYANKADDVRDCEIKALVKIEDISSGEGFSISACTGHHTGSNCCQGFAYMISVDVNSNPAKWRFRKEMKHISYHDSPEGTWTHAASNFKLDGLGRYVGIGFCRYNNPDSPNTQVVLEAWFNPDPDADLNNWIMLKRIIDKPDNGWGNDGDDCGGDRDQVGTWSNAQNRLKTNSTSGSIRFKAVTLREIDPAGSFDQEPSPPTQPPPSTGSNIPVYTFDFKFGKKGNGNGQFQDPHDIGFTASGDLWICDRIRNDFQKFTATGTFITKFGSSGSGDGQFNVPYACTVDPSGNIYVADRENNRIQKLSSTGSFISKITSAGGKNLKKPEDIFFDKTNGDFYVCDTGNDRILKFTSAHTFLLEWGHSGSGTGEFEHPHSICVDSDRNVFVGCGDIPIIQKFSPTGTFIKKWGSEGNGQGQVRMFLEHMDCDAFDRIHLINNDVRPIINVWDKNGNWLTQYGKTTAGSADGQFKEPEHVTCQPVTGRPFVVDAKNQRIQVFNVSGGSSPPPVTPPPTTPPPTPTEPIEITGVFTLMRDINIIRTSACAGTTPPSGGGGGTSGVFYGTGVDPDNETKLSDSDQWSHRIRHSQCCCKSGSIINNKTIKQINVAMIKVGSPTASPTVSAMIWNKNGQIMYTSPTNFDPSTLPTAFPADRTTWALFDFSSNTYVMTVGDRIGVEYKGTSSTNYIKVGYEDDPTKGNHWVIQYENGAWQEKETRDAAMLLWS